MTAGDRVRRAGNAQEDSRRRRRAEQNLAAAKAALRGVITQTENEQRRGIQKRVVDADEKSVRWPRATVFALLNVGGVIATVLAAPDRDGSVQVQAGPMKMTVKVNEVRLVEEKKAAPKPKMQPRRDAPRRELQSADVPRARWMCAA